MRRTMVMMGVAALLVGLVAAMRVGLPVAAMGPSRAPALAWSANSGPDRIVFRSNRGHGLWFAMNADGTDVRALRAPFATAASVEWSADASHVAYATGGYGDSLFVMHSDGTQRFRVTKELCNGSDFWWSPDGSFLAYCVPSASGSYHYVIRPDGTSAARIPGDFLFEGWAGTGRVMIVDAGRCSTVDRKTGRNAVKFPDYNSVFGGWWSPDGSLLAYVSASQNAFCLANARGSGRRCLAKGKEQPRGVSIAWSPSGHRVAFSSSKGVWILDPATMATRQVVRFDRSAWPEHLAWSADAKQITFSDSSDIWVARTNGSSTRRIVLAGDDQKPRFVPASRLAPFEGSKANLDPTFRITASGMLEVRGDIDELAADGTKVAVGALNTPDARYHIVIWSPSAKALQQFTSSETPIWNGLALADDLAAWIESDGGNIWGEFIVTSRRNVRPGPELAESNSQSGAGDHVGNLVGDGSLLAWNEWVQRTNGSIQSATLKALHRGREKLMLQGLDGLRVVAADSGRLLVLRSNGSLAVIGVAGNVLRTLPPRPDVRSASLQGNDIVAISGRTLIDTDMTTGKVKRTWNVPVDAKLVDVQSGVAVYVAGTSITLVDLRAGTRVVLRPKTNRPVLAQLEPIGLYYSYGVGEKSWVQLLPFTDIRQRLGR